MWKLIFFSAVVCWAAPIPVVYSRAPKPPVQFHEATYRLGWDIDMSPYAGGEDILFIHRCLERTEGWMIGKTPLWCSKALQARIWRLSELVMGWLPLNYLAIVAEHEVFGHGYRLRDIGKSKAKVKGYHFGTPPPYGGGGGFTAFDINEKFTSTDSTCVAMAGVESTAILAELTKLKWLEAGKVDPRQSILYLLSQYDLILYIGSLKVLDDNDLDGHDIHSYIKTLNLTYTNKTLSGARLRSLSWMNLADAFTYYSIYAWFHYISSGKESAIPMIPVYGYGWLPGARLGLTPFGPEYFWENYLLKANRPIYFYLKGGRHSLNNYYGLGFYAPKIWTWCRWSLGARFDAWRQPKLLLQPGSVPLTDNPETQLYPYSEQHAMRNGLSASLIGAYRTEGRSGFEVELGWKTPGFLPGYALRAAPVARVYYSLFF